MGRGESQARSPLRTQGVSAPQRRGVARPVPGWSGEGPGAARRAGEGPVAFGCTPRPASGNLGSVSGKSHREERGVWPGPQEWQPVPSSALSGVTLRSAGSGPPAGPREGAEATLGTPPRDEEVPPASGTRRRQVAGPGEPRRCPLPGAHGPLGWCPALGRLPPLPSAAGLSSWAEPLSSPSPGSRKLSAPRGCARSQGACSKDPAAAWSSSLRAETCCWLRLHPHSPDT